MRTGVVAGIVLAMLASGCSTSDESPQVESATPVPSDGPAIIDVDPSGPEEPTISDPDVAPPPVVVPDGPAIVDGVARSMILVLDQDGGERALASYRADGTLVTSHASGDDGVIWQPIWSPDGRRVAWTTSADGASWELVTSAVDGTGRTVHPLPGRPDYISYDPTGSRVLALTPSPEGFGLVIVDVAAPDGEPSFALIDVGQPYFSDFSPAGDRVVAHVGADLRLVDLEGVQEPFGLTSTGHQTPAWDPAEEVVYIGADVDGGNQLLSRDVSTGAVSDLAVFEAFIFFDVDPGGERIAVSAFAAPPADDGDLAALRPPSRQTSSAALGAGIWLVELADSTSRRIADRPATAPMWDPTGSRFLVRTTVAGDGRWDVYDLDGVRTGTVDLNVNGSLLPAYLPFWDQYARSQTLWSPDGGQFVHVGMDREGTSGVWIHDASTTGPSTLLADGDLAFWSPT